MKTVRTALVALIFCGFFFPAPSAQSAITHSLAKSLRSQVIVCTNGSNTQKVVGAKIRCPTGYKKKNVISFITPIGDAKLSDPPFKYLVTASSRLPVVAHSSDPSICTTSGNRIQYLHVGKCHIRWSQSGNSFYSAAIPLLTSFTISQTNQINFSLSSSYKIKLKTIDLTGTSSASLPLSYESTTPTICIPIQNQIQLIIAGQCTIVATQEGDEYVDTALPVSVTFDVIGENVISFNLPQSLLLGLKTYSLDGSSSSGLALTYESLTPDICSINNTILILNTVGTCTISGSQTGNNYYETAQAVNVSTDIAANRVTDDQPDTTTGFQIKAIYVVPSDGTDHSYDTNGYIAGMLDEANSYLNEQLGLQLQIDRTPLGYDIQYMKSKISTAEFMHSPDLLKSLLDESKAMDTPGVNRKNYTFFVDVPVLKDGSACGYARQPGMVSIVAIGTSQSTQSTCTGPSRSLQNYATLTLLHENFHNFGVGHFNDSCDLMGSPPTCVGDSKPTIDKERTRYVGASAVGTGETDLSQDILKLNVWKGYTNRTDLQADCILDPGSRSDGIHFAYCPTGTRNIGALTYCHSYITSDSLEEFINGNWVSLGAGNSWNQPWGPRSNWKCSDPNYVAPWKEVTVTAPGVHHYRWIVNGSVSEELNVLWVQ